ncbi:uncharacterized protein LOC132737413, partial [Ruditapes philippinarum]|uniref:uncharacterized protein LOC132737413 n=1 Tax=Ruditapes philippinarum TaxID=129788 RepID=UPI00295A80D5
MSLDAGQFTLFGIPEGFSSDPVFSDTDSPSDEEPNPSSSLSNEKCAEKVFVFCEKVLKIDNPKSRINIIRAHRIGKFTSGKTRPIVAKFDNDSKFLIKDALKGAKLQMTPYNVTDQYPQEIKDRRKELIPVMLEARKAVLENNEFDSMTYNLPVRFSMDKTVNYSGNKLLDICLCSDLKIVNGRIGDDAGVGSYTFMSNVGSTDTFSHVGGTWTSFVCLEMTKVTDNSYYYYQKHDQLDSGGSGDERVKSDTDGTITGKSNICGSTAVPTAEFHFMVKSGSESASNQYCSPSLLAKMDYTLDTLGVETCAGTVDYWDVCTNRTTMTFNYTTCPSEMLYSSGGEVYCMANLTSTYEYTVVYNTDASPTYRFACIVSNSAGTEASIVYKNCTIDQTPTTNAKQHDGTNIGALVTMEAK